MTVAVPFRVNLQVLLLLPPLEQAPDHTTSRPFVALSVIVVPVVNDAEPVLPAGPGGPSSSRFPGLTERERVVQSALSVPLVSRNVLFGVLNVNAGPDRRYTEYDLQAVSLFAEQAAGAIRNARLYEKEREQVAHAQLVKEFGSL